MLDSVEVIGVLSLRLPLLLGVDRCDIGGWFGVRRHQAGLFAMTDKVLQVLYCAHGGGGESDQVWNARGEEGEEGEERSGQKELLD